MASGAEAFQSEHAEIDDVSADVRSPEADGGYTRRFYAKVDKAGSVPAHAPELGPCWLWTASIGKDGYGKFSFGRRTQQSNRAAWLLAHGSIQAGLLVLHKCDVKACVNPAHLSLGTHQQNADEACARGRLKGVHVQGRLKPGVVPPNDDWMAPWLVQGSEIPTRPMVRDALPKRRRTHANAQLALQKLFARRDELGVVAFRRRMPHEVAP